MEADSASEGCVSEGCVHVVQNQPEGEAVYKGILGFGFNSLTGTPTHQLFSKVDSVFTPLNTTRLQHHAFDSYQEYEVGVAQEVGVDPYVFGMFSGAPRLSPFLSGPLRFDSVAHLYCTSTFERARLSFVAGDLGTHKDLQYVLGMPFTPETRSFWFAVLQGVGTHFVSSITTGSKRQLKVSWMPQVPPPPPSAPPVTIDIALGKSEGPAWAHATLSPRVLKSRRQSLKALEGESTVLVQSVKEQFAQWVQSGHPDEAVRVQTSGSIIVDVCMQETREEDEPMVAFQLSELSCLFEGAARAVVQQAVHEYIRECRFKHASNIPTGERVALYCLDNRKFVRASESGQLFADTPLPSHTPECSFILVRSKECDAQGRRAFGLVAEHYGQQLTASTFTNRFGFRTVNLVSAENLYQSGDFLLMEGVFHDARFIYVGPDDPSAEVFLGPSADVASPHKSRFCIRQMSALIV